MTRGSTGGDAGSGGEPTGATGVSGAHALRGAIQEHLGVLVSLLTAATVIAKVWSVAHGDPASIASLISASGALTSVIGALMAGLPAMGVAPLVIMAVVLPESIREGDALRGPLIGAIAACVVAAAVAPTPSVLLAVAFLVGMSVISGLVVAGRWTWGRVTPREAPFLLRGSSTRRSIGIGVTLALLAGVAWVAGAASDKPWLPAEDISTSDGDTFTGYVLDEDNGSIVVMRDDDRSVVRISIDRVSGRVMCRPEERDQRSLASRLIWAQPDYPPCDPS